jgi:tRNA-splicing ligase RtcB
MISKKDFKKISDWLWEIPKGFRSDMRVPVRVYLSERMLESAFKDRSIEQLINVSTLPGIQKYALAMPDMHEGYSSPIGGVAAIDTKEGIISPGMQGYDINCLSPKTCVLLEHGTYLPISELEKIWKEKKVKFVDFGNKELKESEMIYFLKRYNNPTIYRIVTTSGREIEATGEHPIYTQEGMKEVRFLNEGEKIAIFPFKGIVFEEPSKEIILSKKDFEKTLKELGKTSKGSSIQQILKQVEKLNLLPLRYNSWQLPYLFKIMGFVFGDGYISITKDGKGIVGFVGKREDLEKIREDIKKIGFNPSPIIPRERNHKIKTQYQKEYQFKTKEESFRVSSFAFATLLIALGTPYGIKTEKEYRIPKWIFKAPRWQKRLFLASFFGAELSSPKTLNKYNFYAPQLNMSKAKRLEKNAREFLEDIVNLLKEFGIETYSIKKVSGYAFKGKRGETIGFRLQISEKIENLIRFFETIGYEYNRQKQKEACLAANYLRLKLRVTKIREKSREEIRALYKKKGDFKKLASRILEKYGEKYVTYQFLYHSLFKEKSHGVIRKRGKPRIAFNFPSFKDYKKEYAFGENGLVWDEIEKIEKIPYQDFVFDFTIKDANHNFIANNFVVSNCGVRVLTSEWQEKDIRPYLEKLASEIYKEVPSGLGKGRQLKFSIPELDKILEGGVPYLVEKGYGEKEDIENCEGQGRLPWADSKAVSTHAKNRGRDQVGTLGSGNHFLEIQKVAEIFDEEVAKVFGLFKDQVVIMVHCGSRGLGHQVCADYLREFIPLMINKYKIKVPDKEFACVPFNSPEGKRAIAASGAAANYAWANRQMITHFTRKAWKNILGERGGKLRLLYDVAHNIIKVEKYKINGKEMELAVHRKGATRTFPPGHPEIPERYRKVGQPVLIPGSMGTASYILVGTESAEQSFYTTCHGSGRAMSRHAAIRSFSGKKIVEELEKRGIVVKCYSFKGIAEEAPLAYKNVDNVIEVVHNAGLSRKVAKLLPLAVIKGE